MYRADTDRSDKRQLRSRKVRDPHIDKDRQLDDRYQDDRQRNRPQYKSDDQQDRQDGDSTDDLEVAICNIDQVLGARRFSNEHALVIILFYHLIDLVDLLVYLVAGYFVFGTDDQQLIIVALDDAAHLARQDLVRNRRSESTFQSHSIFNTVYLVDVAHHIIYIFFIHICIHQQHMSRIHIKVI